MISDIRLLSTLAIHHRLFFNYFQFCPSSVTWLSFKNLKALQSQDRKQDESEACSGDKITQARREKEAITYAAALPFDATCLFLRE